MMNNCRKTGIRVVSAAFLMSGLISATLLVPIKAAAQTAPLKVKIGVLTDMTSIFAAWSGKGSVVATQLAVDDFKSANPRSNLDISVVSADFQLQPDLAVAITKKWIDDGVTAIVDVPLSAAALAVNSAIRGTSVVGLLSGPRHDDLTTKECSPNSVQWTYDSSAITRSTTTAVVKGGGKRWFIIRQDALGAKVQEAIVRTQLDATGGQVLGSVSMPSGSADYSSALLQAQSSRAEVVSLVLGGTDLVNAIKQSNEYAIQPQQKITILSSSVQDIKAIGLPLAQGLVTTEAFYWNADDRTRSFSQRFAKAAGGGMPSDVQAGAYSATYHYLKAVLAARSTNAPNVVSKMKELPVSDTAMEDGKVRPDGRMVHDLYLLQVKAPSESKGPWDVYKILRKIPGDEAFRPMSKQCSLVK
ncbi:ABC transporter substrate-binding protein [Paraburkholderia sp. LEh10]|uniref:ABC transporter substrate-binding protein n=1 Tax=Paraburkholderia sp. LEh10 TaxID=2821353 RepID=UPI001AEA75B9|nr:ABC transporter substrate-binding protein [Paraburkholderia sp. LEh10]MBP0590464.1 ABC transporter substrate-binding protein [Paraburkholderia sp. LEh10]